MKLCTQCNTGFQITDTDRAFYKKMDVPEPTLCPACRQQRRLAFRNERTLYNRVCDLCKKNIVSIYPAGTIFPVYCNPCWWSDSWNALDYGIDYDPRKPFFDQFVEVRNRVPRISSLVITSENSEYTNNVGNLKNCYILFAAEDDEECMYGRLVHNSKNCVDCDNTHTCEKCYGSLGLNNCYSTLFSEQCQTCTDVLFGFNLSGCSNCILCTNLRNKDFHIENKPVSREEYERRKMEILASRESIAQAHAKFDAMKKEAIVKYANIIKSENVTGDYLFNCRDTVQAFDTRDARSSGYNNDTIEPTDVYDSNNVYYKPELCYEMMGCLKPYNCKFSAYVFYVSDLLYCDSCHNMNSGIACVGIRKNDYCILNKKYDQATFEKMKAEIVARLKKEGIWGEFFPPAISVFAYNETLGMSYFPLTKEECLKRGWRWADAMPFTYGKETLKPEMLPKSIGEVRDDIIKEVLSCAHCGRNYKITAQELAFYRQMKLPLPALAPECRLLERMSRRNPRKLWHRQCMCNMSGHGHHADGAQCTNEFETTYAPERTEKVFCETCYLKEAI